MEKARLIAVEIISLFERLLDKHKIKVPSEDREGDKTEACIFGTEYYELEDEVTKIIRKILKGK